MRVSRALVRSGEGTNLLFEGFCCKVKLTLSSSSSNQSESSESSDSLELSLLSPYCDARLLMT
jgi:hypothetical protein